MTSFCNTPQSMHAWQRLTSVHLLPQALYQHPDDDFENAKADNTASDSIYWIDDLSIATPYSSSWQYHKALALSATVVCSVGAIMQHAETGLWYQPGEMDANSANTATVKQAEVDTDAEVSTPPIANPQASSSVSFSASSDSTCKDSTCKGLEFIDQQVPQLQDQVRQLRTEMELFQARHTPQNLQTHRTVLAYRSSDLAHRQAELMVRSQQLEHDVLNVTSILAIHPDEVDFFTELLQADTQYQSQLQRLQILENDIAIEFSNPDLDNTQLSELYATYYQLESQLRYTAQIVLADYIDAVSLESPDPLWQEATYTDSLQELMDLSHQQQMLTMEYNTLNHIATKLTERRTELASLLRQYAAMQQKLDGHNQVLQEYVAKRQALKSELT